MNSKNSFHLESSPEPNYSINFKPDLITTYVDEKNLSPAAFIHELLHIYVKNKGVLINNEYTDRVFETFPLSLIFFKDLRGFIGNCLEHHVIYPIYLDLDFEEHECISDFTKEKLKLQDRQKYRIHDGYNLIAVDSFIGKFFASKSCDNSSFSYKKAYTILEQTDKNLYKLFCEFWNDWTTFDINNAQDNYSEILDFHFDDLMKWQGGKKFY